jgi:hypothetical protein
MIECPSVEPIIRLHTVKRSSEAAQGKPNLSLTWSLDPATGKPAARWIIESSETDGSRAAASAA